jgi:SAM-dependent methyltransferase
VGAAGRIYDATWGRLFAALYDRGLARSEEAGVREMRRALLAGAHGRVLELGAGTGLNLPLYPAAVEELILLEPDPHMARQLRARLAASPWGRRPEGAGVAPATLLEASAERLPYPDESFDAVVATLVLCTIPDPATALAEARRVLKPSGRLLLLEHVRAEEPRQAARQDRFEAPWRFLADGCHCNRDTAATLAAAGFDVAGLERGSIPKAPAIVRPLLRGAVEVARG